MLALTASGYVCLMRALESDRRRSRGGERRQLIQAALRNSASEMAALGRTAPEALRILGGKRQPD